MSGEILCDFQPLSFVRVHGFGENPSLVQVSVDPRFLNISSHYLLSPILAVPNLIHSYVGTQSDIISKNPVVYKLLLQKISDIESDSPDGRHKTSDALLAIRAFLYLIDAIGVTADQTHIDDNSLILALNFAVEQDNDIKKVYQNIASAFIKTQEAKGV